MESTDWKVLAVMGVFTVLWYLLRQKDEEQAKRITLLFSRFDEADKAIQALRLQLAEGHYKKGELDAKFDKLDVTFREGFERMGGKFDHMTKTLLETVLAHQKGAGQ